MLKVNFPSFFLFFLFLFQKKKTSFFKNRNWTKKEFQELTDHLLDDENKIDKPMLLELGKIPSFSFFLKCRIIT